MKKNHAIFKPVTIVLLASTFFLHTLISNNAAVASEERCRVELIRNSQVIQELLEPVEPEALLSEGRRPLRGYARRVASYERQITRFQHRLARFQERVERSQLRNSRLSIVFGEYCEEYNPGSNMSENGNLPSLDELTPGTRLYSFVSNPNIKADGEGGYIIDYSDPNYIDTGEAYTSGERTPDDSDIAVRVNFNTRTATLEMGDALLDVSHNYFIDE